jgi:hypothetical protein
MGNVSVQQQGDEALDVLTDLVVRENIAFGNELSKLILR